jgi:hypothetical protein
MTHDHVPNVRADRAVKTPSQNYWAGWIENSEPFASGFLGIVKMIPRKNRLGTNQIRHSTK